MKMCLEGDALDLSHLMKVCLCGQVMQKKMVTPASLCLNEFF
jgi:hypothetical protein